MTLKDEGHHPRRNPAIGDAPLLGPGLAIALAALVLAGLVVLGAFTIGTALLAFVVGLGMAIAAALAARVEHDISNIDAAAAQRAFSRPGDPLPEAIITAFPDPVVALDRNGRIVTFNAKASGVAPALRRGEHASIALRIPELVAAMRRVVESGQAQRVEFIERVPVERWSEAFIMPISVSAPAEEHRVDLILITFHDLTPLHRVEEMRADFVANASHELRTPLAALAGFIETLRGSAKEDPEARERFLGIMQAQANRMARLIDDLLSLSRIELSEHVQPETAVDLIAIVRQVVDGLQMLARDREVKITITAPAETLVVPGDRDELIRVFENLVENALKYGASGKRVEITCARSIAADGRPEAVVAVRDYGPGISAEHLPRLTERFYRVDVAESRAQGGTGLGLALVKHILNRHGGRLAIDSKPGEGATFTIRLPLTPRRPAASA
jgi:two-component system phosphate regulon sensor histidine kinase PhoR